MSAASRVGCIVLAGGRSTRMGANKLVVDLAGKPMIAHVVDAIEAAGFAPPVVVLGDDPGAIRAALAGRDVVFAAAQDHGEGISRSLAAGMAAAPESWIAAIICLGDMPLVSGDLLLAMAAMAGETAIVAPRFDGRRGNPVLWGRSYYPRLKALAGDTGARVLFAEYAGRIRDLEWFDDSILIDIDRPGDLALARRRPRLGTR